MGLEQHIMLMYNDKGGPGRGGVRLKETGKMCLNKTKLEEKKRKNKERSISLIFMIIYKFMM